MSTQKGSESAANQTAQHTPKPWLIEESRSETDSKCIVAKGSNLAVVFFRTDEEKANANLIAAAPDMKLSVNLALDILRAIAWGTEKPSQNAIETAIVTIEKVQAKAEGK